MDHDGWNKAMYHFPSMCFSSPLNTQVLFYDGHASHFDDKEFNIIHRHNIQSFILNAGNSMDDQPNNNGPNTNLKNLHGNARMKWMRHHKTLKFSPPHANSFRVETWEAFKLSSAKTTQKYIRKTPPPPLPTGHWQKPPSLSCS